ncbi:unnamed protein product, partial [Owenia fusiformis]
IMSYSHFYKWTFFILLVVIILSNILDMIDKVAIVDKATPKDHVSLSSDNVLDEAMELRVNVVAKALANSRYKIYAFQSWERAHTQNHITKARRVESEKYIVYRCRGTCGGLGDRLQGIHSTFLLAIALRRKFRIDFQFPCDLYSVLGENYEPWHEPDTPTGDTRILSAIDYYENCGDIIFAEPTREYSDDYTMISEQKSAEMSFNEKYPEQVVIISTNQMWTQTFYKDPRYHKALTDLGFNMNYFTDGTIFRETYNHLFKLQPNMQRALATFMARARPNKDIQLVCAQIRMGHNPSVPQDETKRNKKEWLPLLWDFLSLYNISRKYKLFVTTDSQEVREQSQRLFPDVLHDTEGRITHIDRYDNQSEACKGMEKTILDFTILSKCDILVVSRSNFGTYSAKLRSPLAKLYTFQEGVIHEGFYYDRSGKVFDRDTKTFRYNCSMAECPPIADTRCRE